MSGFAAINGEADGGPLLPPIALTDEVTGLVAAFATMVALHSGVGQVVDVNLLESLFQLMGPLIGAYRLLGYLQPRLGSGIPYTVPRGTYQCADGHWVAISTSAESVAQRVLDLIGVGDDARFATFAGPCRAPRRARRGRAGLGRRPARRPRCWPPSRPPQAAIAPVMTMADIATDPHYRARGAIVERRRRADAGAHRPLVGHPGRAALGRSSSSTRTVTRSAPSWAAEAQLAVLVAVAGDDLLDLVLDVVGDRSLALSHARRSARPWSCRPRRPPRPWPSSEPSLGRRPCPCRGGRRPSP